MKFMERTADYSKWDHKSSKSILDELEMKSMINYIHTYIHTYIHIYIHCITLVQAVFYQTKSVTFPDQSEDCICYPIGIIFIY